MSTSMNGKEMPVPVSRMPRWLRVADKGLTVAENVLLALADIALALIMLLVTFSAVARYLLSNPISGSQSWVGSFLAPAVTFLALSGALRVRRHIGVTFVVTKLPPVIRLATQTLAALITAVVFLIVAYEGALRTQVAVETNQLDPATNAPLYFAYVLVPLGSLLVALRAVVIIAQWWLGDREHFALSALHEPASPGTDV